MRVLLLDDDDDLRSTLAEVIATIGGGDHQCVAARSYGELVQNSLAVLKTDLAVLDINLGEDAPSGLDAAKWLHSNHYGGKIIFLTGHAQNHPLVIEASESYGTLVLEKPLEIVRLFELLDTDDDSP